MVQSRSWVTIGAGRGLRLPPASSDRTALSETSQEVFQWKPSNHSWNPVQG